MAEVAIHLDSLNYGGYAKPVPPVAGTASAAPGAPLSEGYDTYGGGSGMAPVAAPVAIRPDNLEPAGVTTGLAMKQRNPLAAWLLPAITFGIYHLVWYYKIHKEMAEFDRRRSVPVAGPMLILLFLSWTLIAPLISYHNAGVRIRNAQRSAGLAASCSPAFCWLLAFVFGLNSLYMQAELNKVVARYGDVPTGTTVPLYV